MSIFQDSMVVKLVSYRGKYLHAVDNLKSVIQGDDASSMNARWTVELVPGRESAIRLRSCYGRYLTATNKIKGLTRRCRKVQQTRPTKLGASVQWVPTRQKDQLVVKLRSSRYDTHLRANTLRNLVRHKLPFRNSFRNYKWRLDIVSATEQPSLETATEQPSSSRRQV